MKKEDIRQVAVLRIIRAGHGLAKCMNTLDEVFIPKVMIDQYKLQMNSVCFVEVMPTPKEELKRLETEEGSSNSHEKSVELDSLQVSNLYDRFKHHRPTSEIQGSIGSSGAPPREVPAPAPPR